MNSSMFFSSIIAAALLSAGAAALLTTLSLVMTPADALRIIIVILSIAYVCWIKRWLTVAFGWSLIVVLGISLALILAIANPGILTWILTATAYLCVIRCVGRYQRLGYALADGLLSMGAIVVTIAVFQQTGSIALSLWSWSLCLAFTCFIPAKSIQRRLMSTLQIDGFSHAYRTATNALHRLGDTQSH